MQRIDENTYIDESLVTCAEYQLFVDEMRQQGKFYQPDHWNFYQFPQGWARIPVLGIRRSDAIAFCDWLIKQANEGWEYRLPTLEEATNFPIEPYFQSPLGYWLREESLFAWNGSMPDDARKIKDRFLQEIEPDLTQALQHALDQDLERDHDFDWDDDINSNDPYYSYSYQAQERAQRRREQRTSTLARAQANQSRRVRKLDGVRSRLFEHSFPVHFDQVIALNHDHGLLLHKVFDRSLARNANRPTLLAEALAETRALVFDREFNKIFDSAFILFMDLYTLQERIADLSPTFEGIRLVKERTNS